MTRVYYPASSLFLVCVWKGVFNVVCVVGNGVEIEKKEERNREERTKIEIIERFQKSVMFLCIKDRVRRDVFDV